MAKSRRLAIFREEQMFSNFHGVKIDRSPPATLLLDMNSTKTVSGEVSHTRRVTLRGETPFQFTGKITSFVILILRPAT